MFLYTLCRCTLYRVSISAAHMFLDRFDRHFLTVKYADGKSGFGWSLSENLGEVLNLASPA